MPDFEKYTSYDLYHLYPIINNLQLILSNNPATLIGKTQLLPSAIQDLWGQGQIAVMSHALLPFW